MQVSRIYHLTKSPLQYLIIVELSRKNPYVSEVIAQEPLRPVRNLLFRFVSYHSYKRMIVLIESVDRICSHLWVSSDCSSWESRFSRIVVEMAELSILWEILLIFSSARVQNDLVQLIAVKRGNKRHAHTSWQLELSFGQVRSSSSFISCADKVNCITVWLIYVRSRPILLNNFQYQAVTVEFLLNHFGI